MVDLGVHQWVVGPRRIGKTSTIKAVIARCRSDSQIALEVDLSSSDIVSLEVLTRSLAIQARAAGIGIEGAQSRTKHFARRHAGTLKKLGSLVPDFVGVEELEPARVLDAVAGRLAAFDEVPLGLHDVLGSLVLHGIAHEQRVMVLIDEVHLLAALGAEAPIADIARRCGERLVFVFAGSVESAVSALRQPGAPLSNIGSEFQLDDISTEDWLEGLERRFLEHFMDVRTADLFTILEASDNHPRRTMLICSKLFVAVGPGNPVTATAVELAIRDGRADLSWD